MNEPVVWLTVAEAVAYCRMSRSTLFRAIAEGELRAGGTARRRRFRREWLDEWLEKGGGA